MSLGDCPWVASESSTDPAPKILVDAQPVGGGWPVRCASVPVAGADASPIPASTQHLTLETGHRRINGRAGHPSSRIMEIALQLSVLGFHISQTLLDVFDGAHETAPRSGPASNRPTVSPGLVCMLPPQCSPSSTTCNGTGALPHRTHINRGSREAPSPGGQKNAPFSHFATETPHARQPSSSPNPRNDKSVHSDRSVQSPGAVTAHPPPSTNRPPTQCTLQTRLGCFWSLAMTGALAGIAYPSIFGPAMDGHLPGCPDLVYDYPCSIWAPSQLHRCL